MTRALGHKPRHGNPHSAPQVRRASHHRRRKIYRKCLWCGRHGPSRTCSCQRQKPPWCASEPVERARRCRGRGAEGGGESWLPGVSMRGMGWDDNGSIMCHWSLLWAWNTALNLCSSCSCCESSQRFPSSSISPGTTTACGCNSREDHHRARLSPQSLHTAYRREVSNSFAGKERPECGEQTL